LGGVGPRGPPCTFAKKTDAPCLLSKTGGGKTLLAQKVRASIRGQKGWASGGGALTQGGETLKGPPVIIGGKPRGPIPGAFGPHDRVGG